MDQSPSSSCCANAAYAIAACSSDASPVLDTWADKGATVLVSGYKYIYTGRADRSRSNEPSGQVRRRATNQTVDVAMHLQAVRAPEPANRGPGVKPHRTSGLPKPQPAKHEAPIPGEVGLQIIDSTKRWHAGKAEARHRRHNSRGMAEPKRLVADARHHRRRPLFSVDKNGPLLAVKPSRRHPNLRHRFEPRRRLPNRREPRRHPGTQPARSPPP